MKEKRKRMNRKANNFSFCTVIRTRPLQHCINPLFICDEKSTKLVKIFISQRNLNVKNLNFPQKVFKFSHIMEAKINNFMWIFSFSIWKFSPSKTIKLISIKCRFKLRFKRRNFPCDEMSMKFTVCFRKFLFNIRKRIRQE